MNNRKTILFLSLVIIVSCVVGALVTPIARYRLFGSEPALWSLFHNRIKPGDSPEEVARHLGAGVKATAKMRDGWRILTIRSPDSYPDGFQETDTIVIFSGESILQFRNGRLVNHDPSKYAVYRKGESVKGTP